MAYPNYSIVIIESTVDGATVSHTTAFKTVREAELTYKTAINANKRAFIYKQPEPNHFHRNDSQPISV